MKNTASSMQNGFFMPASRCFQMAIGFLFATTLFFTAFAIFVPLAPGMPEQGLDPSWQFGMAQALEQGLVFGRDIVFTYGPYASILTNRYLPSMDYLMVYSGAYLGFVFFMAAWLNFRNCNLILQLAFLFFFGATVYLKDHLYFLYPLLVGVGLYKSETSNKLDSDGVLNASVIMALLFSAFGLLPLIKASNFISCAGIFFISAFMLTYRKKHLYALIICLSPILSMLIFWSVSGQPLSALPQYVISSIPIISGYTEAMAVNGSLHEVIAFLVAGLVTIFLLYDHNTEVFPLRLVMPLMFAFILFLSFKAGFVRHDVHATIAGCMIILSAMLGATLLEPRGVAALIACPFAAWILIDASHLRTSTADMLSRLKSTYENAWNGTKVRIFEPGKFQELFVNQMAVLKARSHFPMLDGAADIYSYEQTILVASGNKWNPRPVFQSYSAYTPSLSELNKNHLINGPEYLIFKTQPIDGRLPALEDGASWPIILSDYKPNYSIDGYLFLRRGKPAGDVSQKLNGILKGSFRLGETIAVPRGGGVVFAEITLKRNFLGDVSNAFFKPGMLALHLTLKNGSTKKYRIVSGMAKSGFVISPLIEDTKDFSSVFANSSFSSEKEVASFSIEPTDLGALWNDDYQIRLFSLQYDRHHYERPTDIPDQAELVSEKKCDGYIDSVNGASPSGSEVHSDWLMGVNGWLSTSGANIKNSDKTYITLKNDQGRVWLIETQRASRPDVGAYFKQPHLNDSGFEVVADVSSLNGKFLMGLAYSYGNRLFVCQQLKINIQISANIL